MRDAQTLQSSGLGVYETFSNNPSPSPLGLGFLSPSSLLASSNLVSIELCRPERGRDVLDADLVVSSPPLGSGLFVSSDHFEVPDIDLCSSSDRRECLDVERRDSLGLSSRLSQALPLRASMNVVVDAVSGMEKSGGGVSCCWSRFRCSASSSVLSPLSVRPSEGMMVLEADVWRAELCVEFMESEKRRFFTVASSTPRRSHDISPEGGRCCLYLCFGSFSRPFSGSAPASERSEACSGFSAICASGLEYRVRKGGTYGTGRIRDVES